MLMAFAMVQRLRQFWPFKAYSLRSGWAYRSKRHYTQAVGGCDQTSTCGRYRKPEWAITSTDRQSAVGNGEDNSRLTRRLRRILGSEAWRPDRDWRHQLPYGRQDETPRLPPEGPQRTHPAGA